MLSVSRPKFTFPGSEFDWYLVTVPTSNAWFSTKIQVSASEVEFGTIGSGSGFWYLVNSEFKCLDLNLNWVIRLWTQIYYV